MAEQNRHPYKILALDGGGFRGTMTVQILLKVEAEIREKYNCALHEYFDLVTGTSTGSLLAAGIALGLTAEELMGLYRDKGEMIFPKAKRDERKWRFLRAYIPGLAALGLYDNDEGGLGKALRSTRGFKQSISDIPKGHPILLIPAYNLKDRRIDWFCSNHPQGEGNKPMWYDDIPIWKICASSSAAPTFFPPFKLKDDAAFIDGGIAVNNPALIGITHALYLPYEDALENPPNFKLDDLAVLSIGTGESIQPYTYKEVKQWGNLQWAQRLSDLFIPAPNDVTADVAWQIIRQESYQNSRRALRLDYAIPSIEQYENPDPEADLDYSQLNSIRSIHETFENKTFGKIDNPDLFAAYRDFAQCYLDGRLRKQELKSPRNIGRDQGNLSNEEWRARTVTPNEAIAEFIQNNQYPTNPRPHDPPSS